MDANADVPCPRRGKWIGGCRFEARFDSGEPKGIPEEHLYWYDRDERLAALQATAPKTYVRDVCVTCGRSVERPAALPPAGGR